MPHTHKQGKSSNIMIRILNGELIKFSIVLAIFTILYFILTT